MERNERAANAAARAGPYLPPPAERLHRTPTEGGGTTKPATREGPEYQQEDSSFATARSPIPLAALEAAIAYLGPGTGHLQQY